MAKRGGGSLNAWHGHSEPKRVPEGVWMRCDGCQATLFRKQVEQNLKVCPECNHHFPVSAVERIAQLLDADTFEEWFSDLQPADPLGFNDRRPYPERVKAEQAADRPERGRRRRPGVHQGHPHRLRRHRQQLHHGSMGSVVGEKLTRAIEEATRQKLPLVIVSGSGGGARMHEGIFSLMQMAKVSTALGRYRRRRRPVHQRADPPDDGRRRRQLRLAGRLHPRRAQGPDRLRRPARHRADRPRPAAPGLPDQRVPAGARLHRPDRAPPRPAEARSPSSSTTPCPEPRYHEAFSTTRSGGRPRPSCPTSVRSRLSCG